MSAIFGAKRAIRNSITYLFGSLGLKALPFLNLMAKMLNLFLFGTIIVLTSAMTIVPVERCNCSPSEQCILQGSVNNIEGSSGMTALFNDFDLTQWTSQWRFPLMEMEYTGIKSGDFNICMTIGASDCLQRDYCASNGLASFNCTLWALYYQGGQPLSLFHYVNGMSESTNITAESFSLTVGFSPRDKGMCPSESSTSVSSTTSSIFQSSSTSGSSDSNSSGSYDSSSSNWSSFSFCSIVNSYLRLIRNNPFTVVVLVLIFVVVLGGCYWRRKRTQVRVPGYKLVPAAEKHGVICIQMPQTSN
eukprot:TRINITY_DN3635_c0_g1_i7.p1 TRINITY_DN3635_c0_g1~~TRINITY_DN3635_c0_g1_i7.p1  ORF type:complete len:303 (-),score=-6.63 TRINITY_DN3635_c0_g1_i7:37-945(-)